MSFKMNYFFLHKIAKFFTLLIITTEEFNTCEILRMPNGREHIVSFRKSTDSPKLFYIKYLESLPIKICDWCFEDQILTVFCFLKFCSLVSEIFLTKTSSNEKLNLVSFRFSNLNEESKNNFFTCYCLISMN